MAQPHQLSLSFACLDFPANRGAVAAWEIAEKLGCSVQHILNQIDEGELQALDLASPHVSRRMTRVPVEEYRAYIMRRLAGVKRREFLGELPRETLLQIHAEITARLTAA